MGKFNISIKARIIFYSLILLIILPHGVAGRGINKESSKVAEECTVSEVLYRLGAAYGIRVKMSKNIQNKIPCDAKYGKDMDEVIKNLLFQENNYAVVWNLKDKGISSVDIRFFESSKKDFNTTNIDIMAMPDHRGSNYGLEMNTDVSDKASGYSGDLRMITTSSGSIDQSGVALGIAPNNSERGRETGNNYVNVNAAADNRRVSLEILTPELNDGGHPFNFPPPGQMVDLRVAFPIPMQVADTAEYFPPPRQ